MLKFANRNKSLGGYRCVSLANGELCIAGEKGEIWQSGPGMYKALLLKPCGDEKIISFSQAELHKVVLKIKVPATLERQAYFANNPNLRSCRK